MDCSPAKRNIYLCCQVAEYLGVSPIMGKDATKSEFLKQMREATVVHVATYGLFEKGASFKEVVQLLLRILVFLFDSYSGLSLAPLLSGA